MRRWNLLLALISLVLLLCLEQSLDPQTLTGVGQLTDPQASMGIMRPVKQRPIKPRSSTEITFANFAIQQMFLSNHPGMTEIKGEPTIGARFFARAWIYDWEAIATAKFEAVDENGNFIQKILINRETGANGDSDFYGVIKIPDRPFRVVMSGEGSDGKTFTRTFERLFKPTTHHQNAILIPPGGSPVDETKSRQLVEDYLNKMEEDVRKKAGDMIVMPRTRVSNVMYAPYFSKTGRQLGLRITYDIQFSQDGYFNPELDIFLDYKKEDWRGRIDMKPLTGSIEPKPEEAGSPQVQPHMLAYGAGYLYKAETTYHFTAEYVPNYAVQNEEKTKFCIYHDPYNESPQMQTALREILADNAPTPYTLEIRNTDFFGVIEGLPSQGILLKNFLAEGAKDCRRDQ
jgi:hypothetical protein